MKLLEADTKKLGYLLSLSYGTLNIPYSQRPYEWGKEQVLRLFNDFYSTYLNPDAQHVLNFITIRSDNEDNNSKYIFDGQQRTVTSLLILTAIVNELKTLDRDAVKSAETLETLYLFSSDWRHTSNTEYKIVFENSDANTMIHKYIFKGEEIPENYNTSDYDHALFTNYNYIVELVHEKFNTVPNKDRLRDFAEAILERVLVIIIETSYENIAEEMFETLNSTGQQLEDFYVLKNTLVRTLSESRVKPYWSTIEINTDRISKGKFLSAYVNTINGKTPSNNLYNRIQEIKNLTNETNAITFLNELKFTSDIYFKIEKPNQFSNGSTEENLKYIKLINTLILLNANQYKPVIIAMGLKRFNTSNIIKILNKIISLQIRNIFIAGIAPNTLEQFYPALAKDIYEEHYTTVEQISDQINREIITDSVLYDHFNNKIIYSSKEESIIRFLLKEIYNASHPEIRINESSVEVNLEHILPKSPSETSQWLIDFSNEELRFKSIRKIGNLTVLLGRLNSSIKNSDFSIKKDTYSQSVIPQNVDLSTFIEWKQPQIDQRTIEIYNQFINIWTKE